MRERSGLNQHEFYKRISVTQSGGSRYESGRRIPGPVQMLIDIAYGNERQARKTMNRLQGVK